jgi:hypothetical protein
MPLDEVCPTEFVQADVQQLTADLEAEFSRLVRRMQGK